MKLKTGIILGSGLDKFTGELLSPELLYEDNSGFHDLKIYKGIICGKEIVVFSGRRHYYEGYNPEKILESISISKKLGLELLIVTNAAGGINKQFKVSDLMLITSHLNFLRINFPTRSNIQYYNSELIHRVKTIAAEEKIVLKNGSYCCTCGPVYESKSEIRFFSKMGFDAVGMSTVPEILFANQLGIKTIAISCITNILSEQSKHITTHEEVIEAGLNSYTNFSRLIKKIISEIG